jgi:hypothetical protein
MRQVKVRGSDRKGRDLVAGCLDDGNPPPRPQVPDKCKIGGWDKMVTMIHLLGSYPDPSIFSLYASYRVV